MLRHLLLASILGILLFQPPTTLTSQGRLGGKLPSWQLAYSHDAHGQPVQGSLGSLIAAVKSGADIKVAQSAHYGQRIILCDAVWVGPSENSVHCHSAAGIGATFDWNGDLRHRAEGYHFFVVSNSSGVFDRSRWQIRWAH
ncbi:MAG TPA: hypothetical protein EYP04_04125 [Anaerolineae bacterium]|nr:hypothetical protein [Anaerolineae bacterium]HIQ05161.1 hypothetical protein [Anaerolineae bacterium]